MYPISEQNSTYDCKINYLNRSHILVTWFEIQIFQKMLICSILVKMYNCNQHKINHIAWFFSVDCLRSNSFRL